MKIHFQIDTEDSDSFDEVLDTIARLQSVLDFPPAEKAVIDSPSSDQTPPPPPPTTEAAPVAEEETPAPAQPEEDTPSVATPAPTVGANVDSEGVRWDGRIHSEGRTLMKSNGKWKRKRGVSDADFNAVMAELYAERDNSPTPAPAAQPAPEAEQEVPAPPPAPAPEAAAVTLVTVIGKYMNLKSSGALTPEKEAEILLALQVEKFPDIGQDQEKIELAALLLENVG